MTDRRKLEALAEAIAHYSGYINPESAVYQARNPGGLRAFSSAHNRDEQGNRIFGSVLDGMQALLFDVSLKVAGASRHHLQPTATLADFAEAMGQQRTAADAYVKFLRKALLKDLPRNLTISFFIEE